MGGGSPYEDGNYGNVGFLDGQRVVPIIPKNNIDDDDDADDDDGGNDESREDVLDEETGGISTIESSLKEEDAQIRTIYKEIAETTTVTDAAETSEPNETEMSPSQDDILHDAVCRALVSLHLKSDFPMAVSTFYAQHVLNSRREGETIQLKQTRYKKFGPYVAEQVERGLLIVDGTQNDPLAILKGYDPRHPDLKEHQRERKESKTQSTDTSQKRMVIADLYCVPNHFIAKLRLDRDDVKAVNASSVERRNTGMLTLKEVRAILESYVARENLIDPIQPAKILLDGPLTDVLYKAKKNTMPDFIFPTTLLRGDLLKQWVDLQEPAYALVELPGNVVLKLSRGKAPVVQIIVTRRQSRKFETRVIGVELYGIDPNSFAKDVAHRFACSSSVSPSESKSGSDEILFQGNLADELEAMLVSDESLTDHGGAKNSPYCLPKNGVEVILRKGVPARKNQSKKKTAKK
jgi:translation initiation factor 2D